MSAPIVYLVRHGETAWSLSGQHTGVSEILLTEHGVAQSKALGAHLSSVHFDRIFSSPRKRAQQTCTAIGWTSATIVIDPDLAEWTYGRYEGLTSNEIHGERPTWNIFADG